MNKSWQRPWRGVYVDNKEQESLRAELVREISPAHPLHDRDPCVIGRRVDNDDILVKTNDGRFAVVHLTWSGRIDQYPDKYPWTVFFASIETFSIYMAREAVEYQAERKEDD